MQSQFAENMKIAHRVTIVGMILDTFLGVGKIFIGLISSSHAVLIDGIHSLSDMVPAFLTTNPTGSTHTVTPASKRSARYFWAGH